jgi:hypothetical protein
MNALDLLQEHAEIATVKLAPYVIDQLAGVHRVMRYPTDPDKAPVIVKRFTSLEKAEDYLLTLCPRPATTRVDC